MASEKQIAANRANARRSTGPKTAAGRARSSRNAYRHGLSRDLPLDDPAFRARMDATMQALLEDKEPTDENMAAAVEAAKAHLTLLEIRMLRREMWPNMNEQWHDWQDFFRLVALDRYERRAHTKRRRATEKLSPIGKAESDGFCQNEPNLDRGVEFIDVSGAGVRLRERKETKPLKM